MISKISLWHVYIVKCIDGTLYTGITINLERRLKEHNGLLQGGAKYTRTRRPVVLVYSEKCESRKDAARREREIKSLPVARKRELNVVGLHQTIH